MKHNIIAKGTTVTDGIRSYIEKKFAKFDKYAASDTVVHTKIEVKDNGNRHKIEVTIPFGKSVVRAEENHTDMYAAIDEVEKKMSRLLRKRKEKRTDRWQAAPDVVETASSDEDIYAITRTKIHSFDHMNECEACEAMEMVGHPFYVYYDEDEKTTCAVYVREDGTYGKIIYK